MSRVGRPKTNTEPVTLRLPRQMIDILDDLRRQEKDIPSRPEMIRRILVKHLQFDDEG